MQHPYKPFPATKLEAAVAAVPLEKYSYRERRLARFGREFVFYAGTDSGACGSGGGAGGGSAGSDEPAARGAAAAWPRPNAGESSSSSLGSPDSSLGGSGGEGGRALRGAGQQLEQPWRGRRWEPWVHEALLFADLYPKVADSATIQRAAALLRRDMLPLRPYMQPGPGALAAEAAAAEALGARARRLSFGCQVRPARHMHTLAPRGPSTVAGVASGSSSSRLAAWRTTPAGYRPLATAAASGSGSMLGGWPSRAGSGTPSSSSSSLAPWLARRLAAPTPGSLLARASRLWPRVRLMTRS